MVWGQLKNIAPPVPDTLLIEQDPLPQGGSALPTSAVDTAQEATLQPFSFLHKTTALTEPELPVLQGERADLGTNCTVIPTPPDPS